MDNPNDPGAATPTQAPTLAATRTKLRSLPPVAQLAEACQDAVWILGLKGRIDYMNEAARRLLAAASPTCSGARLGDIWSPETRFALVRAMASAQEGRPQRFRSFLQTPAGGGAYLDTAISPVLATDGTVSHLWAVARDITSEVETDAFVRTVVQMLPSALVVKNLNDNRYELVNRAAEDLLGLTEDQIVGRRTDEVRRSERLAQFADAKAATLAKGETGSFEFETRSADGTASRLFSVKLRTTHDDLGPRHVIALADDVTEDKAAAARLRQALHAAEQANAAQTAFLANMTHELRTPLNGVIGGADLLAREALSPRAAELLKMIRTSGDALERLLSDLLDLARAEDGLIALDQDRFNASEVIRSAATGLAEAAEAKGLTVAIDIDPDLDGAVLGDRARLAQVIESLVGNAVKFTERGHVRLTASRCGRDEARIVVEDTGVGFDPASKARLFARFQQADTSDTRRFGGAGLGLAIAGELVGLMGGMIDCDSRPGLGSKFWIQVPLPSARAAPAVQAAPSAPAEQRPMRVLLADDHAINRQVIQLMLGDLAEIICVENGAEAVAKFKTRPFDLVLMDMQMPVMDGLAAIREIRRIEMSRAVAARPIIMISANSRPEHLTASAEAGADLHLRKPLTAEALFSAIESVLTDAAQPDVACPAEAARIPQ